MATLSVKTIAANYLGRTPTLSLKEDVFGVYGTNNQARSLKKQLDLIQNKPFVRVAVVTIQGANPTLQADLDTANDIFQSECGMWIYCSGSIVVDDPSLLTRAC